MEDALGMVESRGLATAVTVADVMVKTADVTLLGVERANGHGWVTVKIQGDVAAVNAAVKAGKAIGEKCGDDIAFKVIPRPVATVKELFMQPGERGDWFDTENGTLWGDEFIRTKNSDSVNIDEKTEAAAANGKEAEEPVPANVLGTKNQESEVKVNEEEILTSDNNKPEDFALAEELDAGDQGASIHVDEKVVAKAGNVESADPAPVKALDTDRHESEVKADKKEASEEKNIIQTNENKDTSNKTEKAKPTKRAATRNRSRRAAKKNTAPSNQESKEKKASEDTQEKDAQKE